MCCASTLARIGSSLSSCALRSAISRRYSETAPSESCSPPANSGSLRSLNVSREEVERLPCSLFCVGFSIQPNTNPTPRAKTRPARTWFIAYLATRHPDRYRGIALILLLPRVFHTRPDRRSLFARLYCGRTFLQNTSLLACRELSRQTSKTQGDIDVSLRNRDRPHHRIVSRSKPYVFDNEFLLLKPSDILDDDQELRVFKPLVRHSFATREGQLVVGNKRVAHPR